MNAIEPLSAGPTPPGIRLTALAHGGGCGCKLAPSVLRTLLAGMPAAAAFPDLLVGSETADDAAVYRLRDDLAIVATTDFFMPIVDDPFAFGQIAATNALSDIYAMGGTPILALAVLGMPVGKLPVEIVQRILAGGAATCAAAGIPVAGGHSIDNPEPIYGLVALGTVHPDRVLRNGGAQPGDFLLLTKGLGIGVFSAALRQGRLPADCHQAMIRSTTRLNDVGPALAAIAGVHAMTDVTGFGLLGHLLEMCRASALGAEIGFAGLPVLPGVAALAEVGLVTGAGARNWASYGDEVALDDDLPGWAQDVLCDPQTSGGLLVAVAPEAAAEVARVLAASGLEQAARIGVLTSGPARVAVVPGGSSVGVRA